MLQLNKGKQAALSRRDDHKHTEVTNIHIPKQRINETPHIMGAD